MADTRLDDAEAMRNLWDETGALVDKADQLRTVARRLCKETRRFARSYVFLPIEDPRPLLLELGAALELIDEIQRRRALLEDAIRSLDFVFQPNRGGNREIQARALAELKVRITAENTREAKEAETGPAQTG